MKRSHSILTVTAIVAAVGAPVRVASQEAARASFRSILQLPAPGHDDPVFHLPTGALWVSSRNQLLVLDRMEYAIRVFDRNGVLVRQMGGRGRGPREFESPSTLHVVGDRVFANDMRNRRVSWFSLDGNHLGTRPYPDRNPERLESISMAVLLRNGNLFVGTSIAYGHIESKRDYGQIRFLIADSTGRETILHAARAGTSYMYLRQQPKYTYAGSSFGPAAVAAVLGDSIIGIVDTQYGRVRYFRVTDRGAELMRSRNLSWVPRAVATTGAEDRRRREIAARANRSAVAEVMIVYPTHYGRVSRAHFAPNGDLWLREYKDPETAESNRQTWYVVPWSESRKPYALQLPERFLLYSISGNLLVGFDVDENRTATARVYEVTVHQ